MRRKAAHLPRHQFPIRAPALHETVGRTVFDDPASLQHNNAVEIAQRRKTMRDCDYCTPAHQARKDRKSTRLNSSHANISYAVFCLKKKKKHRRASVSTT